MPCLCHRRRGCGFGGLLHALSLQGVSPSSCHRLRLLPPSLCVILLPLTLPLPASFIPGARVPAALECCASHGVLVSGPPSLQIPLQLTLALPPRLTQPLSLLLALSLSLCVVPVQSPLQLLQPALLPAHLLFPLPLPAVPLPVQLALALSGVINVAAHVMRRVPSTACRGWRQDATRHKGRSGLTHGRRRRRRRQRSLRLRLCDQGVAGLDGVLIAHPLKHNRLHSRVMAQTHTRISALMTSSHAHAGFSTGSSMTRTSTLARVS